MEVTTAGKEREDRDCETFMLREQSSKTTQMSQ